jgi:hypothetical protein
MAADSTAFWKNQMLNTIVIVQKTFEQYIELLMKITDARLICVPLETPIINTNSAQML